MARVLKIIALVLICSGLCVAQTAATDSTFSGTVVDAQGRPVPKVQVIGKRHNAGGGYEDFHGAETDASGSFTIEKVGPAVSFRKEGYRPVTVLLASNTPATVKLPRDADSTWRIPDCRPLEPGQKQLLIGGGLRVTMPRDIRIKHKAGTTPTQTWCSLKVITRSISRRGSAPAITLRQAHCSPLFLMNSGYWDQQSG
jgi:hypothetical protein